MKVKQNKATCESFQNIVLQDKDKGFIPYRRDMKIENCLSDRKRKFTEATVYSLKRSYKISILQLVRDENLLD